MLGASARRAAIGTVLLLACGDGRRLATPQVDACARCHGTSGVNAAPPRSGGGATSTTDVRVGAHQLHVRGTVLRSPLPCSECHVVPATVDAPGHMDAAAALVTWGPLATGKGALAPTWGRAAGTCASTYCHGATLSGGTETTPAWTYAAEPALSPPSAAVCGRCHGYPPPSPHLPRGDCHTCHPGTVRDDGTIDVVGGLHVNGAVDLGTLACTSCHGDPRREPTAMNPQLPAAPPVGTQGETSPSQRAVGAHQAHLNDGALARAFACSECHDVPTGLGHVDGRAEVVFGPVATHGGTRKPVWDGTTCAASWCHGNVPNGNLSNAPVWTGTGQAECGSCHGIPPPPPHPQLGACAGCHPAAYSARTVDLDLHVNGRIDFGGTGAGCDGCHGYPPASGAHGVHVGYAGDPAAATYGSTAILQDLFPAATPTTAPARYSFGCGNCHPLDPAKHMDGSVEIELTDAAAPAGSLKSLASPSATYDVVARTCSGAYCHSSGQQAAASPPLPAFVTTPAWDSGATLACDGCHANPPRYPSGGAGAPDANTHLGLAYDGWEFGHFGGQPGPWHPGGPKHGAGWWPPPNDASPLTCQTCHFDTVDPANAGPSGFYYLDTGGNYDLGGSLGYACAGCHVAGDGEKPTGSGAVLPLRHVNGSRDVVFDPRTSVPSIAWLPAAPFTPTRPTWVTDANPGVDLPPGAVYDPATIPPPPPGQTWPFSSPTLSLQLSGASYDRATKTCSSVGCHLAQASVQWGGVPDSQSGTCSACHGF